MDDTGVLRLGFSPLRIENAPCVNNNHELGSITRNATGETLLFWLVDGALWRRPLAPQQCW